MSVTLQTNNGRSNRDYALDTNGTDPSDLRSDELMQLSEHAALDLVTEPIVVFSALTSHILHVNQAACQRLGYTRQELRRLSLLDIAPHATRANLVELFERASLSKNHKTRLRTVYRRRNGSMIPMPCSIRALERWPESVLLVVGHDISETGSGNWRRSIADSRDSLTLLPNRDSLWRQLEREVRAAQRRDYQFAVLFIDIDRFKEINDSCGHVAGDQVLQAVARRLMASVRPNDAVTRYGGDEFVVLLKDVGGESDVRRIAKRISRAFDAVGDLRGTKKWRARVTVSVGAAICGGVDESAVDALERADQAMYQAKALGRNGRFVIDKLPKSSVDQRKIARKVPMEQNNSEERI